MVGVGYHTYFEPHTLVLTPEGRQGDWYKLSAIAYPVVSPDPTHEKVGQTIDEVIKPFSGWICGYVPKWEPNILHRRMDLVLHFSVVYPKFL